MATNALLERRGEPVVLVTTAGFADALRIAYQNRPDLFALDIRLPELLHGRTIEVPGRVTAQGEEIAPLDLAAARAGLEAAFDAGIRACAILFMHAWRFPDHEGQVAALAREIGFTQVSVSHEVSPLMRLVGRGDTTVADAYLSPILARYVKKVGGALDGARLMFMQSNGGLTEAGRFAGRDAVLSGPAGGIVGAVKTAALAGIERLITFDMGGTSTDVAHFDGAYERDFETEIAGVRLRAPILAIHTVAAGGGSILHFRDGRFQVGPDSAGADPGPACYRKGGPLTVTDANLVLGRIRPDFFPAVFGPGADQPLDVAAAEARFAARVEEIEAATGRAMTIEEVAEGYLRIAVDNMAAAIKKISTQRGRDVTRYGLVSFGGAGGQHACRVADALGMTEIFIHPLAGVLSALGMGLADQRELREAAVEETFGAPLMAALGARLDTLAAEAQTALAEQGVAPGDIAVLRRVHLRYRGTDTALVVALDGFDDTLAAFDAAHLERFGFTMPEVPVIAEAVSVEAVGASGIAAADLTAPRSQADAAPAGRARAVIDGEAREVDLYRRAALGPGTAIDGPAIILEDGATTVIEPGWSGRVDGHDHLMLSRTAPPARAPAVGTEADPVMLEVFNNLFMSIAEQMGTVLRRTSVSTNIRERLDFSCAVFDDEGALVANAPHMPVHLGSMSESVRTVIARRCGTMRPGDVYVLNDPYNGGTHLPDVTVITPVFDEAGERILFYVASRGHHADIGGITPGSMPPHSHHIDEEGVLIDNVTLVAEGRFRERDIEQLLQSGRYPARNVHQNIADLRAQIAANEKGVQELHAMTAHFGLDVVRAYMRHVQDNAEGAVRRVLGVLRDGHFRYPLDDGSHVDVRIAIAADGDSAVIDFSGTSPQQGTNFNAPSAVARAAVLYVFRTLVDDDIPMNDGCLKPLSIVIPPDSMLSPRYPAAVVAGNVETSQVITDALYGALGVMGAAQGTMNNVTFGNERYQYYETICGGSGAGPDFDGTDAVHTHMTNSRLTDPEVLEWRFPVRLESFAIRRGSGGGGRHRGGDGAVRRIRFLEPMTVAIVANHRVVPPYGMAEGEPGAVGRNFVERADGTRHELGGTDQTQVQAGDVLVIETPGGGGYGPPDPAPERR